MNLSFKSAIVEIPRGKDGNGTKILNQLKNQVDLEPNAKIKYLKTSDDNTIDEYKITGINPHQAFHLKQRIENENRLNGCRCSTSLDDQENPFAGIFNVFV